VDIEVRTEFQKRLHEAVAHEAEAAGSYHRLATAVNLANERMGGRTIERRKLARIGRGDNVPLTYAEIEALDIFLKPKGRGLTTLLERPTILRSFVDQDRVSLFIGAKAYREDDPPHYESTYVSGWDVRSLAFMERAIGAARPGIRFGVEEVFLRSADELARMRDPGVEIAREAWNEIMTDGQTSAIVTIGTQRACHATEVCLATMLGVAPFKRGADPRLSSSPVQFVWSCDEYDRLPSSFAVIGQQREISPSERPRKTIALKVLNKTFEVRAEGDLMYDFGLIAAQRRRTGIWLVIAGLSGRRPTRRRCSWRRSPRMFLGPTRGGLRRCSSR